MGMTINRIYIRFWFPFWFSTWGDVPHWCCLKVGHLKPRRVLFFCLFVRFWLLGCMAKIDPNFHGCRSGSPWPWSGRCETVSGGGTHIQLSIIILKFQIQQCFLGFDVLVWFHKYSLLLEDLFVSQIRIHRKFCRISNTFERPLHVKFQGRLNDQESAWFWIVFDKKSGKPGLDSQGWPHFLASFHPFWKVPKLRLMLHENMFF